MVIKGKPRGHGRQLASYLLALNQNEEVRILNVDGMEEFSEQDFRNLLGDMSLNEQLTRSRKGIYHAIINPSPEEAAAMNDRDWLKAAEILTEELGLQEQRKAIILHKKYGRVHAHVPIERYDHQKCKMIDTKHNYRKHDKARARMEAEFQHKPTARRNPRRPEMKAALSQLWQQTADAKEFMREAKKQGYIISAGFDRSPFMVVDDTGRSFNLVRHLEGVKLPEVRQRMKDHVLIGEKEAIAFVRTQAEVMKPKGQAETTGDAPQIDNEFARNLAAMRQKQQQRSHKPKLG